MDVRCDRCGTEYEFDDALISERGTTVKCTNCGYQFRIFPASSVARAPERWVVRTQHGRELVFTSLRDLQKGIAQRQVGPSDLLSRGNQPARPLAAIAELEPFFRSSDQPAEPPAKQPRTIHGVAPPPTAARPSQPEVSEVTRQVFAAAEPATAPVAQHQHLPFAETTPVPAVPPRVHTAAWSPESAREAVERFQSPAPGPAPEERFQSPAPGPLPQERFQSPAPGPLPVERFQSPAPGPLPVERFQSPVPGPFPGALQPGPGFYPESGAGAVPAPVRHLEEPFQGYQDLQAELELEDQLRARRSRSRWIAGVLGAAALLLLAATFGRSFVERRMMPPAAAPAPARDLRVVNMLQKGEQHLASGDFEAAKEEFDKASALAEQDPAVLLARARWETTRADLLWLKLKLMPPASDGSKALKSELARRVARARDATQRAERATPKEGTVQALSVDVLRLSEELDAARARAAVLPKDAVQPQGALALALLDLSQPGAPSSETLAHLRSAAKSEGDALRARTALVYALASAGERAEAASELERLLKDFDRHPLAVELEAFVEQAPQAAETDAEAQPVAESPRAPAGKAAPPAAGRATDALPGDFRVQLQQANKALAANNLARAEKLYNAVLAKHPGNTEALAGLADVAHRRQDTATAEQMYERVLKENPSYLPALMASADQKWARGDRKGAIALYRRVLEQAEAGSAYGQRAAARIAQGDQAPAESAPADAGAAPSAPPEQPAPPPAGEQPPPEAPHIDTTDLPGAQP